ncbi:MAG: PTS sugar transporter subunit IIA [Thermogemmatispora sp.]|uniref:PTS sugar transporter subunit IIA n=1 Tax=Thermogemmatispora sp. TaxID=1968838 RepID=UPI002605DC94|nr:PTS sugar transporter subunit IIA [Thermogemmatispora sp.]MBX5455741.1 PTS sugar transporter subunit IIA [Thermogemmatispora sp.]
MIGVVLVSHGSLAAGLKDAVEMIAGPQEHFVAIGMPAGGSLEQLRREVEAAVRQMMSDGEVLILIDILGGNPASASLQLALQGTQVICGVNLPMLLEILVQREYMSLRDLTPIAIQAAKEGVINLTQRLADRG